MNLCLNSVGLAVVGELGNADATTLTTPRTIRCPTCRRAGDWFATPFGPFCSKRCRLIDLGKWFGEEHAISEPLTSARLEELADTSDDGAYKPPKDEGE